MARRAQTGAPKSPPKARGKLAAKPKGTPAQRESALETRDLTPRDFPVLAELFGDNGGCANCWCMWWRLEEGERLQELPKGDTRARQKRLVESGRSQGVLAFKDGKPVGWAAWARRTELGRLQRSPTLGCDDAEQVHSVPCFFIKAGHRGQGVATALLAHALRTLKREGARIVESYPVETARKLSNSEAFTGTVPFFEKAGFVTLRTGKPGRQRARKTL
ncbi:MAG: GNAT family N-acetyltransferase [Deltaproteobacteria bacterium]|nr:GNAT family N-acetyltransferase [Deltaproteobacteria bacterium]